MHIPCLYVSDTGLTYSMLCNVPIASPMEVTDLSSWLHGLQAESTQLDHIAVDIT